MKRRIKFHLILYSFYRYFDCVPVYEYDALTITAFVKISVPLLNDINQISICENLLLLVIYVSLKTYFLMFRNLKFIGGQYDRKN